MSIETVLRFAQLGLSAPVLQAIDEIGYETPSPIQAQSIPPMLAGRDLLGQAQTGTGKTAAFALPLLCNVDPRQRTTQALVLTPTRELAIQVSEAIHSYAKHLDGVHVLPVYGGQHISAQLRPLQRGVHIVVGTPGRIIDHLDRRTLKLDAIRTVVLDEADEMLRMGFIEDVDRILGEMPTERQVALFSATMPSGVRRIADSHLRDPAVITIKSATSTVDTIAQHFLIAPWRQKLDVMTRILETTDFDAMLIFVRTKVSTLEVAEKLEARGHAVSALNGDMNQPLRERTIQRLRDGSLDIVVATDVAARGLDVGRISHVVNYDIPTDTESYVHRIGRTGRAGREGSSLLLVQPREKRMLRAIERATGQPITPMRLPSTTDVVEHRVSRFKEQVSETVENEDLSFFDEIVSSIGEEQDLSPESVAAALAFLVQRERPLRPEADEIRLPDPDREESSRGRGHRDDAGPQRGRPGPGHGPGQGPGGTPYRIEVGKRHGAQPKHIVGAMTNEGGLDGRDIGRIEVYHNYSIVGLPPNLPPGTLQQLQDIQVFGHPLRVSPLDGPPVPRGGPAVRPYPRAGSPAARPKPPAAHPLSKTAKGPTKKRPGAAAAAPAGAPGKPRVKGKGKDKGKPKGKLKKAGKPKHG